MNLASSGKLILALLVFFQFSSAFSQSAVISGIVTDPEKGEPLPGVKVILDSTGGAITNPDGSYSLTTEPGKHFLIFSFSGYDDVREEFELAADEVKELNVMMKLMETELDIVVITGSQYEKKLGEETVSIDIIKPYLLENNISTDLSDAVRKVPGVNIIDGQANIRGSSGYSFGAGSRVLVLLDDMPILSADVSDVRWQFIPIEISRQVEVIKGPASALYGSAAMNGVINVRTGFANEKPETKINFYQGVFFNPQREELRWWKINQSPYQAGIFMSHRRRIKDRFDLVIGGNASNINSFRQNGNDDKYRFTWKTRYQIPGERKVEFGVNGTLMWHQFTRFFMWEDADAGAYKPLPGTEQIERYFLSSVDPWFSVKTKKAGTHRLDTRFYNIKKFDFGDSLNSMLGFMKYQYTQQFEHNVTVVGGLSSTLNVSKSNLFGDQKFVQASGGVFVQAEKKFFNKLSVVAGMRYELFQVIDSLEQSGPLPRIGLNYQAARATFLRGSFGMTYRQPSFGERFIDASIVALQLFPNPELRPETGLGGEIGIKQGLKIDKWKGFVDAAIYWNEYKEMIEWKFVAIGGSFGFQSQNITQARIIGYEVSAMGEGKIGYFPVRLFGGYTFSYGGDLVADPEQKKMGVFMDNLITSITNPDSVVNSILRYRTQHQVRLDAEVDIWKFTIGMNMNYNSYMLKIDQVFEDVIPGVKNYREENNTGDAIFDIRAAFQASDRSRITLLAKNVANREYAIRPGMMDAPASLTLQYRYQF